MDKKEYLNIYSLLEKYGFSYDEVVKISDDCAFERIDNGTLGVIFDNSCKYLLSKGYSVEDIKNMVLISPRCLIVSDAKRKVIEDTFLELGMTQEDFRIMSIKCGNVFAYSKERIDEYINFFKEIGFSNKDIVKVFKYVMFIFRTTVVKFRMLYEDMLSLGFTKEDIYIIAKGHPAFWTHNINKVENIINTFINLGFSMKQARNILRRSPSLLGYSDSTIINKFNSLLELGFSLEELIFIVSEYPSIINGDIDRTSDIIEFFKSIGLYESLLKNPKSFFMQGLDTSYSRYCYYMDKGKVVDAENYSKLFYGSKKFEKYYGFSKEDLLLKYPYDRDKVIKKK